MKLLVTGAALAAILLSTRMSAAQSSGELRTLGRQATAEIAAAKSAGRFDTTTQRSLTERVGKGVLQYIDLCDKAASAGSEKRDGESLRAAFDALHEPLSQVYDASSGAMEKQERKIMEEDGDLEALYETAEFKTARITGSQALYYLNWLEYYGSRFHEGAKRKQLLEQAQKGFAEFTGGDKRSDLLVESQLGRGLCALELGNIEAAEHDLKAVMNDETASGERRAKARLALLDGYVRNGRSLDALRFSDSLSGNAGEDNVVRYLRIRALLDAAKKGPGAEAARYRQQAMALMDQLRRAGGAWEERVNALLASVDNPEDFSGGANSPMAKWQLAKMLLQKNDFKQAAPLLEGVLGSTDPALKSVQAEARYYLALTKFQNGQLVEAIPLLDQALENPNPAYAADAAYVRFKAMETLLAAKPDSLPPEVYEAAVRAFASFTDHKSNFEAQFRLGELLQRQHKFDEAIESYQRVNGDPTFALRAEFAQLQCHFEILQAAPAGTTPAQRNEWMKLIADGLANFPKHAEEWERKGIKDESLPLAQMRGKWALMKASFATLDKQPDYAAIVALLGDFEKQHPDLLEFLPPVVKLRLVADQQLGRFQEARIEVKNHGDLIRSSLDAKMIEELAGGFIRQGALRRSSGSADEYAAAEQVALALYELLVNEPDTSVRTKLTLARLYENNADGAKAARLYRECLEANPSLLPAMRGLARIAESEMRLADALVQWEQFAKTARGGDLAWYEGKYEVARLTNAVGKRTDACQQLTGLRPAMPGLSDAELKKKFGDLYEQVCKSS